jgi:hypothetical protein
MITFAWEVLEQDGKVGGVVIVPQVTIDFCFARDLGVLECDDFGH